MQYLGSASRAHLLHRALWRHLHTALGGWEGDSGVQAPLGAGLRCPSLQVLPHSHPCPHRVKELVVDQHSHTRTTGSSSFPVTHCKTSPFPVFVFTSQLGFPRGGTTQENKPPLMPSCKCVHMKLIKNIPDYFFKQYFLPAFFSPNKMLCFFITFHLALLRDSCPRFPVLVEGQASLAEPEGI